MVKARLNFVFVCYKTWFLNFPAIYDSDFLRLASADFDLRFPQTCAMLTSNVGTPSFSTAGPHFLHFHLWASTFHIPFSSFFRIFFLILLGTFFENKMYVCMKHKMPIRRRGWLLWPQESFTSQPLRKMVQIKIVIFWLKGIFAKNNELPINENKRFFVRVPKRLFLLLRCRKLSQTIVNCFYHQQSIFMYSCPDFTLSFSGFSLLNFCDT